VAGVVAINPFRQKPFTSALTASRERGAAAFGPHARAKTVLAFACALGWLISAFHKAEKYLRRELRAVTLGWSRGLSMRAERTMSIHSTVSGQLFDSQVARARDFWNKQCKR
jgi:hypothetical protein